jgi:hypothetical protein
VPAADEVSRLQRGTDAESCLFQQIAEQGHYAGMGPPKHTGTRQGTYAASPSGILLASINSNDPRRMAEMLRRALERWSNLAPSERLLGEDSRSIAEEGQRVRAERFYPKDGLVLRIHTRDLLRAGGDASLPADWRARALNQDFAWFTRDEARQFVPENLAPGEALAVPDAIPRRLARLHFVDNVRGQTPIYREHEVESVELTSGITGVSGPLVTLRLEGRVRLSAEGVWPTNDRGDDAVPRPNRRGFDGEMLGSATWETERQRFTAFDMLAVGMRWGGTQYNRRHDDLEPTPMGIALTLGGDSPAERVAPAAYWSYGWP